MTKYISSEKVWQSPDLDINYNCSLGEAILTKLNEIDPTRVLEINIESNKEFTVEEIRRQTIIVARNLQRLGVQKGDTLILFSRSHTKITPITFACYALGVPVNFFEITFENEIIRHTFEMLNPTIVIFEEEFRDNICSCLKGLQLPKLKHAFDVDSDELFKPISIVEEEDFQPVQIEDPSQYPATLIFTSGSTGMPKIVILSHALMMQGLYNKWWPLDTDSIICSLCDLRWVVQVELMMQPVFFGAKRIYTSRSESAIASVEEKRAIIDKFKITHFFEVPMHFLETLKSVEKSNNPTTLSSLRIALVGGEVVADSLVEYSKKLLPNLRVIKCYGMTEVSGAVCTNELVMERKLNGGTLKNGFMVKIIDDDGCSLGPNEAGRLCLKSTVPFLGYLKNDKANLKAFLEDGWYDTGDCACVDSDNLLSIGTRYHDLVRSSDGVIIVPSVVECIVNSHPYILSSALVGHSSGLKDSNEYIATLFVVLEENTTAFKHSIQSDLRECLRNELTNKQFQIVRYIRIIEDIPLKACGKADRNALRFLAEKLRAIGDENFSRGG